MVFTSSPTFERARTADSRPAPGPLTRTSIERIPTPFAAVPAFMAAWVAANGVPLRDPLKPIAPALDHDTTLPSASVIVTSVLLNEAWMWATPLWTTFFSPRFLKTFLRPAAPDFFSSAMVLHRLLLRDGALARALPRARVGLRALASHRQAAAMPQAAVAADLHQALDVERNFLAEVPLHAAHFFDHLRNGAHILFRQVLDPHVRADARCLEDVARALAPDAEDVGESDLD